MTIIIVMKKVNLYSDIENFRFEPLALVKAKLSEFSKLAAYNNLFIVVTKNGKPQTVLVNFDLFKKLLKQRQSSSLFELTNLKRKKRNPLKEKWLKKWNQLGPYEKD